MIRETSIGVESENANSTNIEHMHTARQSAGRILPCGFRMISTSLFLNYPNFTDLDSPHRDSKTPFGIYQRTSGAKAVVCSDRIHSQQTGW
jgi:hypothetical protein